MLSERSDQTLLVSWSWQNGAYARRFLSDEPQTELNFCVLDVANSFSKQVVLERAKTNIVAGRNPESRGQGFKPRWSPEFFRLLYAIAKIAFITAKIIASLDFISAVHIWFISYTIHQRLKSMTFSGCLSSLFDVVCGASQRLFEVSFVNFGFWARQMYICSNLQLRCAGNSVFA